MAEKTLPTEKPLPKEGMIIKELQARFKILLLQANEPAPWAPKAQLDWYWLAENLGFKERDRHIHVSMAIKGELPFSVEPYAGVIVTGGLSSVYEKEPWMIESEEFLRRAHEKDIPILGVCFGCQQMAQALGGVVAENPLGREVGWNEIFLTSEGKNDPLFRDFPSKFIAHVSHKDTVLKLPEGGVTLAQNEYGIQAFRCGLSYGVMFHPEMTPEVMMEIIESRKNILEEEGIETDKIFEKKTETPHTPKIVSNFAHIVMSRHFRQ